MAKQLKKWQGWTLFGGAMVVVFLLGLLVSSLMERRAEVASVFNNKRTQFTDSIIAQNEKFKADYPREYETWSMTEDTSFVSKYNSSQEVDVLEQRPEMVVLWAGYAFSRHFSRATITHPVATSTPSTTCARFCVPAIQASTATRTCSLPPAGLVRVPMCPA